MLISSCRPVAPPPGSRNIIRDAGSHFRPHVRPIRLSGPAIRLAVRAGPDDLLHPGNGRQRTAAERMWALAEATEDNALAPWQLSVIRGAPA